jgi:hypothetical protein
VAPGITQPSGAGTTIFVEDDAHADAGGDGSYSFLDIATKFPADFNDLGTSIKAYRARVSVQNGDGAGSALTTIKDQDCAVFFDTGRTLLYSLVGQGNRTLELGVKVQGAAGKASGRRGVGLWLGASSLIRGNHKIYGSMVKASGVNANLNLAPTIQGCTTEIINSILRATNQVVCGSLAVSLTLIYNGDIDTDSLTLAPLSQFRYDDAERAVIAANGGPAMVNTSGAVIARDLVFVGTPTEGDLRNSGVSTWDMVNPTWSGNNFPISTVCIGPVREWWSYDVFIHDPATGLAIANVPIRLLDGSGVTVVSGISDADGRIVFGAGIYRNAVHVRTHISVAGVRSLTDNGPFTTRVNLDGVPVPGYVGYSYAWMWPRAALASGYGHQLISVMDPIRMVPTSGGGADGKEEWRAAYA